MIVTFNFFSGFLKDANSVEQSAAGDRVGGQSLTAAGSTTGANAAAGTIGVVVSTDTAITGNFYGSGSSHYMPAGSTYGFPAVAGQVFTIATV
jgi:hypothetical protein